MNLNLQTLVNSMKVARICSRGNQGCELAKRLIKFKFTKNLQAEFEFFIFNFASSSSVVFTEFVKSSSSFHRV